MDKAKVLKFAKEQHKYFGNDPIGWIRRYINFDGTGFSGPTDQQVDICEWLTAKQNVCVSSGGGTGKSAIAALLIQWFLITHPFSKIPTTAPNSYQLNDVLWSEIDLWLNRNRLKDFYTVRSKRLFIGEFKEWYAVARTIPKDQKDLNDTLAGFHAPFIFIAVDEASGVPDPVFTALEGAMTNKNSFILLISNPVSTGGYYYDTINDPDGRGQDYKVIYLDSRESPLVDPSYEQRIINRYGKNHPMYQAKVMGLPISEIDTVVVPPNVFDQIVVANKLQSVGKVVLGCDAAGSGENAAVLCYKRGKSIFNWETFSQSNPTFLSDEIMRRWERDYQGQQFECVVDAIGEGAGVASNLEKEGAFPVHAFISSEKAVQEKRFDKKRTEGYYNLKTVFPELHFPMSPPERLKKELANIRFDYSSDKGPISIIPKSQFKRNLGFSPDYSDALMLACLPGDLLGAVLSPHVPDKTRSSLLSMLKAKRSNKYGKFQKFVQ